MAKLIYIADDDKNIRKLVSLYLENEGYEVNTYPTGDSLLVAFNQKKADLVILDIMMPGTDGLMICQKLRNSSTVPIIMLTAKDTDTDFVAGITYGSDDYLVKPFSPTQLNMRVKALLRRVEMLKRENGRTNSDIQCGSLKYDDKKHSVFAERRELHLTSTELALLKFLMAHYGEAISREELLDKVWGIHSTVETRVTDETVRKIRKKLRAAESNMQIRNKWGFGYRLESGDEK